ncbi:hypothetical protein B0A50_07786 [Salinomyces thailandicus]|uniref:Uncharacterized protein n=1 Tax=Salinomyces thailandicus TaxID=706561 RepID=A0A4U0TL87_9PEZI|nr:hypothetical protein B0A50_07786 [Salinomyces thailandica]
MERISEESSGAEMDNLSDPLSDGKGLIGQRHVRSRRKRNSEPAPILQQRTFAARLAASPYWVPSTVPLDLIFTFNLHASLDGEVRQQRWNSIVIVDLAHTSLAQIQRNIEQAFVVYQSKLPHTEGECRSRKALVVWETGEKTGLAQAYWEEICEGLGELVWQNHAIEVRIEVECDFV